MSSVGLAVIILFEPYHHSESVLNIDVDSYSLFQISHFCSLIRPFVICSHILWLLCNLMVKMKTTWTAQMCILGWAFTDMH